MVGLGRMGGNMTTRLLQGGHEIVAYDVQSDAVEAAVAVGAVGASSLRGTRRPHWSLRVSYG